MKKVGSGSNSNRSGFSDHDSTTPRRRAQSRRIHASKGAVLFEVVPPDPLSGSERCCNSHPSSRGGRGPAVVAAPDERASPGRVVSINPSQSASRHVGR